jgi:hypothetical protein
MHLVVNKTEGTVRALEMDGRLRDDVITSKFVQELYLKVAYRVGGTVEYVGGEEQDGEQAAG